METTNTNNPTTDSAPASVSDHMAEIETWLIAFAQAQTNYAVAIGREDVSTVLTLNDEVMDARAALLREIRAALLTTEARTERLATEATLRDIERERIARRERIQSATAKPLS